jgi:glycosyltransferase involved in cell wall biosynthesis
MRGAVPIAFYAPMKSPDHPSPSGDRTMARLLITALRQAGFAPELASRLRTWDGVGNASFQEQVRRESLAEADALVRRWRTAPTDERPELFFAYHVYYKSPDWIGPRVADALGIPYVVTEASRAKKRAGGPWGLGHGGAEAALDRADVIFSVTAADRESLVCARPEGQRIVDLPPFLDLAEWGLSEGGRDAMADAKRGPAEPPRLLAVGMMRMGDKLASYRLLAQALAGLSDQRWRFDIVGEGEARGEIEALFAPFGEQVALHGAIEERAELAALYAQADLFVWPAVNEAYGMVLLEAQAFGCPVLAGDYGGVSSVVRHGETGLLTAPGDAAAFAEALRHLMRDPARRRTLGSSAARFVAAERGIASAAERLRQTLTPLAAEAAAT